MLINIKALILLDFIKAEYFNREQNLDYKDSKFGKSFINVLNNHGLKNGIDYDIDFVYNNIPTVNKKPKYGSMSYKKLTVAQLDESFSRLDNLIKDYDIIVPTGLYGLQYLFPDKIVKVGKKKVYPSITKLGGHDVYKEINDKSYLILPIFSPEYVSLDYQRAAPRNHQVWKLSNYLNGKWELNYPRVGNYVYVNTVDMAKKVLDKAINCFTSWDTETSSLEADDKDSRILCMTLSYKAGTGYYIPLGHRQSPFNSNEVEEIKGYIKKFIEGNNYKVAHNSRYDQHWLYSRGIVDSPKNTIDTKVGYWLLVNQQIKETLKLTDLSWELTPMGGYDDPLEDYKNWLSKTVYPVAYQELKKIAKEQHVPISKCESKGIAIDNTDDIKDSLENDNDLFDKLTGNPKKAALLYNKKIKDYGFFKNIDDAISIIVKAINHYYNRALKHFSYDWIPINVMVNYAVGDADSCLRIAEWELNEFKKYPTLKKLFIEFYPKFVSTLAKIESNGAFIDKDYNKVLQKKYAEQYNRLYEELREFPDVKQVEAVKQSLYEKGIVEMAKKPAERNKKIAVYHSKYKNQEDRKFNPTSPSDKSALYFDILKLTLPNENDYKTSKGFSTGKKSIEYWEDHLKEDSDQYKLVSLISQLSKIGKIKNSFADTVEQSISDKDGCIHAVFNETGTSTSRISSSKPNLQNQPSHTDVPFIDKYPIKRQFISRFKNGIVFNCDYANLELRILGLLSNDENMYHTFANGEDIHKETASQSFKVKLEDVTPEQRQNAKRVSFGIIYGISDVGLSKQIKSTKEEAKRLMDNYLDSKPAVESLIKRAEAFGKKHGYAITKQGFRETLFGMYSNDYGQQSQALRKCTNTMVQGTGAFLTNNSLIYINKFLKDNNLKSKIALTVHDSIFGDVPEDEVNIVVPTVRKIMTTLPIPWLMIEKDGKKIRYPIDADMQIGYNYHDLVDFNLEDFSKFDNVNEYINSLTERG